VIVNLSEAKAKLSKLIDLVYHGEWVTIAKNNLPPVDTVPHKPQRRRRPGLIEGMIQAPDNFDEEDPRLNESFCGYAE
jgi:prevent-host-death family protein